MTLKEKNTTENKIEVRAYKKNDELIIVESFNQVFHENRSLKHWNWKFQDNPQGGPCVSMAWAGKQLAAHYTAYPLRLTVDNVNEKTYHVGDIFTVPAFRGIGIGKTSLINQVVRHFHKHWCYNQVDFFFGFLTGVHLKLGKRVLSYETVAPLFEYQLLATDNHLSPYAKWSRLLKGYRIELVEQSGDWADDLFKQAKKDYSILVTRDKSYLHWRYDSHPDFNYHYVLLKKWGKMVAWCIIRKLENKLLLVDALCQKKDAKQMTLALQEVLASKADCEQLLGWFADSPQWWGDSLLDSGFIRQREYRDLELCVSLFSSRFTAKDLSERFYYAMGDSDMF